MKRNAIPLKEPRKLNFKMLFIIVIAYIAIMFFQSCVALKSPKDPCKERRGMMGYGYRNTK